MIMRFRHLSLLLLGSLLAAPAAHAQGQTCTADQFRKVVDDTGAALRRLNGDSQPKIEAGFRRLKDKHGWSEAEYTEKAAAMLSDAKSDGYDATAGELLGRLDRLSEEARTNADCARLAELESAALELQATVRVKTQYMLTRIDVLLGEQRAAAAVPPAKQAPAPAQGSPGPSQSPAPPVAAPDQQAQPSPPAPPAAKPAPKAAQGPAQPKTSETTSSWTTTSRVDGGVRPAPGAGPAGAPPPPPPGPMASAEPRSPGPGPQMPPVPAEQDGFSIDEIKDASRGFFGTISGGLASVIEHAFSRLGRPTAYVLGNEGGGAFIAGVRYGKGLMYMRSGNMRDVYWHGPSIGYDFGASGSKTLFLVYNMRDELDIFAGFSGVEGSAYLVGGVGMTILTDGKVVMAPIRSGVGLRLGASIGYVRFTPRATWNPF